MVDIESTITHIQIIKTWAEFARERDLQFFTAKHLEDIAKWSDDAIELLKEHQKTRLEIAHEMVSGSILMYQGKELIRCKDCKHKEESVSPSWEAWCNRLHCGCDLDWFCADGELNKGSNAKCYIQKKEGKL